jgi:hypothetical protein
MAGQVNMEALALPVQGDRFRLERWENGLSVVRLSDRAAVGRIDIEEIQEGLLLRALCIDEAHRSYGAGSEAARLFNRACDDARVPLVRTWAPPDRGLSVYFWIRMGYRPLHGEGPDGGIWFERRSE